MIITKEVNAKCFDNISKEYCKDCVNQAVCPIYGIYSMGKRDAFEEIKQNDKSN